MDKDAIIERKTISPTEVITLQTPDGDREYLALICQIDEHEWEAFYVGPPEEGRIGISCRYCCVRIPPGFEIKEVSGDEVRIANGWTIKFGEGFQRIDD